MVLAFAYDQKCPLRQQVLKTDVTLVQTLQLIILDFFYQETSWCNKVTIKAWYGEFYAYKNNC